MLVYSFTKIILYMSNLTFYARDPHTRCKWHDFQFFIFNDSVIGGQQHSKLITLTLQIRCTLQVACPCVASVISEVSQKFCSFLGSRHLKIKLERNATRKNMSRHTTTGYNVCKEKSTQAPSET